MLRRANLKKEAIACFQGCCAVGRRVRAEEVGDAGPTPHCNEGRAVSRSRGADTDDEGDRRVGQEVD